MNCILCRLQHDLVATAGYVVFGLSLCTSHVSPFVSELADGGSVRDILTRARDRGQ